ncbi:MAG: 50S ribosomal protein L18 [Patescibacteria group bacterium]
MLAKKQQLRYRRHHKIRTQIQGSAIKPRLSVYRSNKNIYAQLVDDEKKSTIVSANDLKITKTSSSEFSAKLARAYEVGLLIGQAALDKKIKQVVFDRAGYKFHGRVKALAEGARKAGLKF